MKSSRTGFSRFLLTVDKIGKNISKLIRRSERKYTIHIALIDTMWLKILNYMYRKGIWYLVLTPKDSLLEQVKEENQREHTKDKTLINTQKINLNLTNMQKC